MQRKRTADCLVVGAGPAGLVASFYLRRFLRHVVVADQGHSRALAIERTLNFPAFPHGVSGHDLLQLLHKQLTDVRAAVIAAEVTALHHDPLGGCVPRIGGTRWSFRTVLLATGVVDVVPRCPASSSCNGEGCFAIAPSATAMNTAGSASRYWATACMRQAKRRSSHTTLSTWRMSASRPCLCRRSLVYERCAPRHGGTGGRSAQRRFVRDP